MTEAHRILPFCRESEEAILGLCLLDAPNVVPKVIMAGIGEPSFYNTHNGIVFKAILDLFGKGMPVDLSTVAIHLKAVGEFEKVGGYPFLTQISSVQPTTLRCDYYVKRVKELHTLREVIRACSTSIEECHKPSADVNEVLGKVTRDVQGAANGLLGQKQEATVAEVCEALIHDLGVPKNERESISREVSWGLSDVDRFCGRLGPGTLNILAGRPSSGKAHPMSTQILTPHGYWPMSLLKVGDEVIGPNGKPRKIIAVHPQGVKPVFKVLISDGTFTRCCAEHLWFTTTKYERRSTAGVGSVKNTLEVLRTIRRSDGGYRNHALPLTEPVEFAEQSSPLPMHPWLLGALLGDGKLGSGNVQFCKPEKDLQERVMLLLPNGDTGTLNEKGDDIRVKRMVKTHGEVSETLKIIRSLGVAVGSLDKFIPEQYLFSSVENRLELLRGLLDTDGFCDTTAIEYCSSSEKLMNGVAFLVRSLGGICTVTSRIPKFMSHGVKKDGSRSWRSQIWFGNGIVPVSSKKHLSRLTDMATSRHVHRSIIEITPDGEEECQCITVDAEDGLYLANDFIVTHNSSIADQTAWNAAKEGKLTIIFSYEMPKEDKITRIVQQIARMNRDEYDTAPIDRQVGFMDAVRKVKDNKFLRIYERDNTLNKLIARVRATHQKEPVGLVVIDFLQRLSKLEPTIDKERTDEKIGRITTALSDLAKECKCPVLLLSAMNREGYKDGNAKPTMAALRNSGEIESDADVIAILHWPKENPKTGASQDPHDEGQSSFYVEFLQDKGRNKGVHQVGLMFDRRSTSFSCYQH